VEAVYKLEAEGDCQGQNEQQVRPDAAQSHATEVLGDVEADEPKPNHQSRQHNRSTDKGVGFLHFLFEEG